MFGPVLRLFETLAFRAHQHTHYSVDVTWHSKTTAATNFADNLGCYSSTPFPIEEGGRSNKKGTPSQRIRKERC